MNKNNSNKYKCPSASDDSIILKSPTFQEVFTKIATKCTIKKKNQQKKKKEKNLMMRFVQNNSLCLGTLGT